jgi:hypothetical protein
MYVRTFSPGKYCNQGHCSFVTTPFWYTHARSKLSYCEKTHEHVNQDPDQEYLTYCVIHRSVLLHKSPTTNIDVVMIGLTWRGVAAS